MKNALALLTAAALVAAASVFPGPATAYERWPDIPPELGIGAPIDSVVWIPYRCSGGPVHNFYHNAYYAGQAPAIYRGYAYRPYYRYAANRVIPREYFCSTRRR